MIRPKLTFPTRKAAKRWRLLAERRWGGRRYVYRQGPGRFRLTSRPRCWWLSVEPAPPREMRHIAAKSDTSEIA